MRGKLVLVLLVGLLSFVGGCKETVDAGELQDSRSLDYSKGECWASKPEKLSIRWMCFMSFRLSIMKSNP